MSARARLILIVVVSVLVLVAFFFLAIRPRQAELGRVRDEIEAEENRTVQLRAELRRLQDLQARAPELQAELEQIRQFVPRRHEVANFIFQVQNAANRSGIGFLQISPELPKPPPEGAELAEVRLTIGAKGGYFAIQDFIRRLYALDRAVRADLIGMSAQEREGTITIDLQVTARIFFELPEEGAGTAPARPPPTPSPDESPEETSEEEPFETPTPSP